jgi:hypothetical protein
VRINSGGGSVFAAYAIMNLLKSHKAQIITYNDGIAASAATIIAMAGDKIVTALGSVWMVHLPSVVVWDIFNVKDLDKLQNRLATIGANMVEIYHHRTGIDKAALEKMLEEETWMTGTEAKEKGFADEVTDAAVDAHLNTDGVTATFNDLVVSLEGVANRAALVAMIGRAKPGAHGAGPAQTAQNKPAAPAPANNNGKRVNEEVFMNLEELKSKRPEIYKAAFGEGLAEGAAQGAASERERIKAIDAMALPGLEALTDKAKFETGISAGEYAVEVVKAQKAQGAKFLAAAQEDAKDAGYVPAAGASQNSDEQEETALLNHTGKRAETLR